MKFLFKEFIAIRQVISLNKTFFYFVEITTLETRHAQKIHRQAIYVAMPASSYI